MQAPFPPTASPSAGSQASHPVAPVVVPTTAMAVSVAPLPAQKPVSNKWDGGMYHGCMNDVAGTFFTCCCPGCVFLCATQDAYEQEGSSTGDCFMDALSSCFLSNFCCCCTLCCCPTKFAWCYCGQVLARFRHKYNLPELDSCTGSFCGRSEKCFPECWQMTCCGACVMCLMYRTMNKLEHKAVNKTPYDPASVARKTPEQVQMH